MLKAKLALTVVALGLLAWEHRRGRQGRPFVTRVRNLVATGLVLAALFVYADFGRLRGMGALHSWDTFHYYIGAKYFAELSYTRLYACTAVAEAESQRARLFWSIRDLESGRLVPALPVVERPDQCKRHFSEQRWNDFKRDAAYFWKRVNVPVWASITTDHGFNATPVWMVAGTLLANLAPASHGFLSALVAIDSLLLLAATAALAWAFGARATTLAVFFFAVNEPSSYGWVGGAFLRHDWLAFVVLSICLARKGRPAWAGACLAYASLLRIFPVMLFAGPAVLAVLERRRSGVTGELRSFFLGAAAAGALLLAAGAAVAGPRAYAAFLDHIVRFEATPLTNHVGLKTALSYRPSTRVEQIRKLHAEDPWPAWGEWRRRQYRAMIAAHLAILALFAVEFVRTARRGPTSQAMALGTAWIPLVPQLTCYYYSFPAASAALTADRHGRALDALLLGAALGGQLAALAFSWWDDQYAATSVAFAVWALLLPVTWKLLARAARVRAPRLAAEHGDAVGQGTADDPAGGDPPFQRQSPTTTLSGGQPLHPIYVRNGSRGSSPLPGRAASLALGCGGAGLPGSRTRRAHRRPGGGPT